MNIKVVVAGASTALFVGAVPASALVIDAFESFQEVDDLTVGDGGVGSEIAAETAIGGYRDMYVEKNSGPGSLGVEAVSNEGILSFSNDSLTQGSGWLTWDGLDDDPLGVNTTGLGGVDLLAAGPLFDFEVIQADQMLEFTMRVWDMDTGFSEYFEVLPPVEQLDTRLRFSQFEGDANFSDVGAIQIFVNAPQDALDASIGDIEVIPLPASALLLLGGVGGLGGLGALRSRRRRSAA